MCMKIRRLKTRLENKIKIFLKACNFLRTVFSSCCQKSLKIPKIILVQKLYYDKVEDKVKFSYI